MSIVIVKKQKDYTEFWADTQSSRSSYKDKVSKIGNSNGFTFGVTGDLAYLSILKFFLKTRDEYNPYEDIEVFLLDVFTQIKKFSLDNEVANLNESEFLIAFKNNLFEFSNFALIPRQDLAFIGSGSNIARAFIKSGLSIQEAIKKSSELDVYVNAEIEFLKHENS